MTGNKPNLPDTEAIPASEWSDDTSSSRDEGKHWDRLDEVRLSGAIWWQHAYNWVVVMFTIAFSILFLVSIVSWAWHYLTPVEWYWLNEGQLSKIQSVIFSGGLGAVLSAMIQKQLARNV